MLRLLEAFAGLRTGVGESGPVSRMGRSYATAGHALVVTTTVSRVALWDRNVREGVLSLIAPERADAFAFSFLAPWAVRSRRSCWRPCSRS